MHFYSASHLHLKVGYVTPQSVVDWHPCSVRNKRPKWDFRDEWHISQSIPHFLVNSFLVGWVAGSTVNKSRMDLHSPKPNNFTTRGWVEGRRDTLLRPTKHSSIEHTTGKVRYGAAVKRYWVSLTLWQIIHID